MNTIYRFLYYTQSVREKYDRDIVGRRVGLTIRKIKPLNLIMHGKQVLL